jgi:hypothetical protein
MAHAGVLLGDLGRGQAAREYGTAALLLAQEAEVDEAIAWSVQAKTARWTGGFVEAAEFARRGFEVSGSTPTKVELAYREAKRSPCSAMPPIPQSTSPGRARRRGTEHRHVQRLGLVVPARQAGPVLPLGRYPYRRRHRRTTRGRNRRSRLERRCP